MRLELPNETGEHLSERDSRALLNLWFQNASPKVKLERAFHRVEDIGQVSLDKLHDSLCALLD